MTQLDGVVHLRHIDNSEPIRQVLHPFRDGGRCFRMPKLREHCLRNHNLAKKLMQSFCLSNEDQVIQRRGVRHDDACYAHDWRAARSLSPLASSSSQLGCCSAPCRLKKASAS